MEDLPVHPLPPKPRYGIMDLTLPRGIIAGVTVFLSLAMNFIFFPMMFVVGLIGLALMAPSKHGYGYMRVKAFYNSHRLRREDCGRIYTTSLVDRSECATTGSRKDRKLPPFEVEFEVVAAEDGGELSLLHHDYRDEDVAMLQVDGWTSAANADPFPLLQNNLLLYQWMSDIMRDRKVGVRSVSYFYTVRPVDRTKPAEHLAEFVHLNFLEPANERDAEQVDDLYELTDLICDESAQVYVGMAITAPRGKAWRRRRSEDPSVVGNRELSKAPVVQAAKRALGVLRDLGVEKPGIMTPLEMAAYFRAYFDVSPTIQAFYKNLALDYERIAAGEITSLDQTMTMQRGPWPSEVALGYTHLQTDTTFTRTFQINGFESQDALPDFFQRLLAMPDIWFTVAFVAWPVSGFWAEHKAKQRQMWHLTGAANDPDKLPDPKAGAKMTAAAQERVDLFASHKLAIDYGFYITVSATSPERLEADVVTMQETCSGMNIRTEPVMRESRQLPAALIPCGLTVNARGA